MAKPIYALVGEDSFLQLQKLREIRAQLPKDIQTADFDGQRAELSEVLDELRSFAMFGSAKLVVVRNADDFITRFREQLEDYVKSPSSSGTLILRCTSLPKNQRIYGLINKAGQVEQCEPPAQLAPWITNRAREHKLTIDPPAASLLAELVGRDMGRLDNELAKLALQVTNGKVTRDAVLGSVAFQREQEIKEMTLELATGQPTEALKRWRQLVQLDTSAEFRAVVWLTMWLEDVGAILSGAGAGKMAWKYRDRMPQFVKMANGMSPKGHQRALDQLAELDRRSKSGLGDAVSNVERFILSFVN